MASMSTKGTIDASPDKVWAAVSDFGGLDAYFPPVARVEASGSGVGMERQCTFPDGAQISETLLELDHDARSLRYDVHDPNPFPFEGYTAAVPRGWTSLPKKLIVPGYKFGAKKQVDERREGQEGAKRDLGPVAAAAYQ